MRKLNFVPCKIKKLQKLTVISGISDISVPWAGIARIGSTAKAFSFHLAISFLRPTKLECQVTLKKFAGSGNQILHPYGWSWRYLTLDLYHYWTLAEPCSKWSFQPQPMKHRSIHSAPARTVRQKFSGTISGYHERCFAHWIPAPAKTTPKTRKVRKPRPDENFPLCLVCDRDASDVESSFECLVEKFDRSVKRYLFCAMGVTEWFS